MEKFITLNATACALPLINIDTDMIIPKQFLKTIERTGLGKSLFYEMRFDLNEKEISDFVLNKPAFRNSKILIARDNFGCGSSREHAPWALLDFGIRAIIAPSFADIFYNNCFKNSILPIILPSQDVETLLELASHENNNFTIDLVNQEIKSANKIFKFNVDKFKKHCLIEGLDDIGLTLQHQQQIKDYESKRTTITPWLFNNKLTN
jgi:3-isopropylmalate/(R)-2-methylmalate dehydratase small subunit